MNMETLKKRLGERFSVSSLPRIVAEVERLLADPSSSVRQVGEAVAKDPPLAAKLLRTANSAYYGLRSQVVSPQHAACILGLRSLRNLVLQTTVIDASTGASSDIEEFWSHSILTAQLAGGFPKAKRLGLAPDELYLAGLMHDIGHFAMLDALGSDLLELCARARAKRQAQDVVEREALGFDHAQIGTLIAVRWNLPQQVVQAIRDHHDLAGRATVSAFTAVCCLSNQVAEAVQHGRTKTLARRLPSALFDRLEIQGEDLEKMVERAAEMLPEIVI